MHRMLEPSALWPPAGIQVARRFNPPGRIDLPMIADHRVSLHLSARTITTCRESGQRFLRRHGHVDLTPADCSGAFDADEDYAALDVQIPCGFLQRVAQEMQMRPAHAGLQARHLIEEARLCHLMLAIEADHCSGAPGGRLYTDSLGVALAVQLLAGYAVAGRQGEALSARQVQRVVDFIEANLDVDLSLDALASVAGVSRSYLQRAFRSSKGTSLHRYVVERRVERARLLLIKRSLPASEIALAVGFANQSHMARWMRRLLGVTPRELLP
ncbi:hypothetical protein PI87_13820 [Ralstonia sp. A12]|uniref:helix-turn-helix transcriptional regulator n=1 Tax=Ralstonia sp. A12 TaxID=1217052 RepID=UPI00057389AB|nr:AraC family transcriptional regulator [Ralstonia sp. A12]KHK55421.1 hypothetical protein PI87_13820 [Ralstonia sp. A12]